MWDTPCYQVQRGMKKKTIYPNCSFSLMGLLLAAWELCPLGSIGKSWKTGQIKFCMLLEAARWISSHFLAYNKHYGTSKTHISAFLLSATARSVQIQVCSLNLLLKLFLIVMILLKLHCTSKIRTFGKTWILSPKQESRLSILTCSSLTTVVPQQSFLWAADESFKNSMWHRQLSKMCDSFY